MSHNKNNASGMIFIFNDNERAKLLLKSIQKDGRFTDALSYSNLKLKNFEICFISFDGESLSHVCLLRLGNNVVTAKSRVLFSNFFPFSKISFEEIEQKSNIDYRTFAVLSSSGNGKDIKPSQWQQFVDIIKSLSESAFSAYKDLLNLKTILLSSLDEAGADIIAQERDSLALATDIFGLDREDILFSWAPVVNKPTAPFLEGIVTPRFIEDPMIIRDTNVFEDWEGSKPDMQGNVQFVKDGQILTVVNFNRHKVEENTGVDLIYYNHSFNSYVLVQYKRLRKETERITRGKTRSIYVFRPTQGSYNTQVVKMNKLSPSMESVPSPMPLKEYRLNEIPFYFKFCLPFNLELGSTELIKGMYFPLDYLESFFQSDVARGPDGGVRIVYQDSERHINNTMFTEIVKYGWIGSRLRKTKELTEIIKLSIEQNKSVIFAHSSEIT